MRRTGSHDHSYLRPEDQCTAGSPGAGRPDQPEVELALAKLATKPGRPDLVECDRHVGLPEATAPV